MHRHANNLKSGKRSLADIWVECRTRIATQTSMRIQTWRGMRPHQADRGLRCRRRFFIIVALSPPSCVELEAMIADRFSPDDASRGLLYTTEHGTQRMDRTTTDSVRT